MPPLRSVATTAALLSAAGLAAPHIASAALAFPTTAGTTTLVDRASDGSLPSDGLNYSIFQTKQSLSADGNRAVFESEADALHGAAGDRTERYVYVRDRAAATTTNVCAASDGTLGNDGCSSIAISPNGQWVTFRSSSTNLVPGVSATNHLYRKNLSTGVTDLVTRKEGAAGAPMDAYLDGVGSIADNGTVVFATADDLDPAVDVGNSRTDVYVRTTDHHTRLVSRLASPAGAVGNAESNEPVISGDGTTVVFESTATNFQPVADTNGVRDVYVTNTTGSITPSLISRLAGANQAGNGESSRPSVSQTGQFVSFTTEATNLFSAPITTDGNSLPDIVLRDRIGSVNTVATISPAGAQSNAEAYSSIVSPDGSAVAYSTTATSLGATGGNSSVTILRRPGANTTAVVSRANGSGAIFPGGPAGLATGGSAVAIGSSTYPGLGDTTHVFVATPGTTVTDVVSRPTGDAPVKPGAAYTDVFEVGATDDSGRYVVFSSSSAGLVAGVDDGEGHVYLRDNQLGTTTLLDRNASGQPANDWSGPVVISGDGSTVAFLSGATNLAGDAADDNAHIFVGRLGADGQVGGLQAADRGAGAPVGGLGEGTFTLSRDGSAVTFSTTKQLVAADTNAVRDVYVRNLTTGTTTLVSRADGPAGAVGTQSSSGGVLSADGTKVAFDSYSPGLVGDDGNGKSDAFVRDLVAGTTTLISRGPGGAPGASDSWAQGLSADGTRVSFVTNSTNLGGATNGRRATYVRDLAAGTTTWASAPAGGAQPSGDSEGGSLSADGSKVAFVSTATNVLVPDTNGDQADGFVRDLASGAVTRIAVAANGEQPSRGAIQLSLSGNGHCAVFTSAAPDLVPGGYTSPDFYHVYLRAFGGDCPVIPTKQAPVCPDGTAPPCPELGTPKDTIVPKLDGLKLSRKSFSTKGKKKGTKLTFTLSEPATIKLEIAKTTPGRKKGKSCVSPGKAKKGAKKCTRVGKPKSLPSVKGVAGKNTLAISGKVGKKALPKGSYRLLLTATDPAGNTTKSPAQIDLRIK